MPMHGRAQRPTLTYAQMYGGANKTRAQRPTLTYSQMYGSGYQEGMGIWSKFKKFVRGAAKKTNKFLKKSKIISKVGSVVGPIIGTKYPGAGDVISGAAKFAGQHGYGIVIAGGAYNGKCKNISAAQCRAIMGGYGHWLPTGGVSLAGAGNGMKNISAAQVKALAAYRGRMLKGGGISLAIRKAIRKAIREVRTLYRKTGKAARKVVRKKGKAARKGVRESGKAIERGIEGFGMNAAGIKLAGGRYGMGIKLAGGAGPYVGMGYSGMGYSGMGIPQYKKKRVRRVKPQIIYRM